MIEFALFLREAIAHPMKMGAACPTSKKLSRCVVDQTPQKLDGLLVELGAGTGPITLELNKKFPSENIVLIERSKKLINHLRRRFPALTIIQGDACRLSHLLPTVDDRPVEVIVSSLPLRSLPRAAKLIGQELNKVLKPGGLFIQYTYNPLSKPLLLSSSLRCIYSKSVKWNFPPSRIDVYQLEK